MTNAYSTYRQPLFILTDGDYRATGCIAAEPAGHFTVRKTDGSITNGRKTLASAIRAAEQRGHRVVSSSWYEVSPDA